MLIGGLRASEKDCSSIKFQISVTHIESLYSVHQRIKGMEIITYTYITIRQVGGALLVTDSVSINAEVLVQEPFS